MQLFKCSHCHQPVYFDNNYCTACQHLLGFDSSTMLMVALESNADGSILTEPDTQAKYRYCANAEYAVCNWVIPQEDPHDFCLACRLNRVIPNLNEPHYRLRWHKIELAKHRLVYSLLRWKLPLQSRQENPESGLAFDFKANPNSPDEPKVMTGHDNGVITLNIAEADDVERAMERKNMEELYRTLLGHFRHEIGHYYWDVLVDNTEFLEPCRQLFGDERMDYQEALDRHYHQGPPADWMERYISTYATMHPWEDWAETWAHYLHIVDVLETADSFGMQIHPHVVEERDDQFMTLVKRINPYYTCNFDEIYQAWLPVAFAMNSLNRSMGQDDFYPFLINPVVQQKLKFIHDVIQTTAGAQRKVA
ncbi:uncharacterized protein Rv2568c [Acinetobacter schindleri]|uniref:zinc-binding metallopeptidase family protein n=1 Tax=Acinetobacter schindleri TaxID=108981 RepID=UPI0030A95906